MTAAIDVLAVLLRNGSITPDQFEQVRRILAETGADVEAVLVGLGYATREQIGMARAECLGLPFVDLANATIPPEVLELVPESVARENLVLPLARSDGVVTMAVVDPYDNELLEKLQFILNRDIRPFLAIREQIIDAIDRHYGQTETESVDSMLQEFTDTQIDFTDSGPAPPSPPPVTVTRCALELEDLPESAERRPAVERHATVRYYQRMNPGRMFPLLVILSRKSVEEVRKRGVAQAQSKVFAVAEGSTVEVEPVLPGCSVYPSRAQVRVEGHPVTAHFWVLPHALGRLRDAQVVLRQGGETLAALPLDVQVVRQSLTVLMGCLSVLMPFALLLLKQYRLDFESQFHDGFGLYARLVQWSLAALTPEALTCGLLAATGAAYLWLRPRRRDVFWDVKSAAPADPSAPAESSDMPMSLGDAAPAEHKPSAPRSTLLERAGRLYAGGDYPAALACYEQALGLSPGTATHYFQAALAAHRAGDTAYALAILRRAEQSLSAAALPASLWYNMGCFAARLGQFPAAITYLNRAADAGYTDPARYLADADLEPLRWQPGFKSFIAGLRR